MDLVGMVRHNRRAVRILVATLVSVLALGALMGQSGGDPAPPSGEGGGSWVVVMMNTGERLTGELLSEDDERIVVRVAGLRVEIPRDTIETLVRQRPLRDRYLEMRRLIDDGDVGRLLTLVEWLRVNGLYEEALAEVEHILRVEPNEPDALRQRELIRKQIELKERAGEGKDRPDDREAGPREETRRGDRRGRAPDAQLLTAEQINLIKVYEIDLADPPEVVIKRETIDKLLQGHAKHPLVPSSREGREAFHRMSERDLLDVMFRVQARELYGEVRVMSQPRAMRMFRDDVHRAWLVNRCGSIECHGGGSVWPYIDPRRSGSDESVYTNFLTLERARLADGEPLINYARPADSLLLHMGLPRDETMRPHPDVRGFRPAFRSRDDERFREAVAWIEAMYQPRPEYPIDYEPPVERPGASPER